MLGRAGAWERVRRALGLSRRRAADAVSSATLARLRHVFRGDWYLDRYPDVREAGTDPLEHYLRAGAREGRDPHPLFDAGWYLGRHPGARGRNPLAHYLETPAGEHDPGPLFDARLYLAENDDVRAAGFEPLTHYTLWGWREGRRPNRLFDPAWYRAHHQPPRERDVDPLEHYLRFGLERGADPHPLFATRWYAERNPDIAGSGLHPLAHYLRHGAFEQRDPGPLFRSAWYVSQEPALSDAAADPLTHYLERGWRENRWPNPLFEPRDYLRRHPKVAEAGVEPLTHFVTEGCAQGHWPNRLFDLDWYTSNHADVAESGLDPLAHYLEVGAAAGYDPHIMFASRFYLETNPDVAALGLNPLAHYLHDPVHVKRWPHPLFDPDWYRADNPDVVYRGADPLIHFVEEGLPQGRDPNPWLDVRWYLRTNPDAVARAAHPVHHYLHVGGAEGRDPGPFFETGWYRRTYLAGDLNGPNPLAHFLHGGAEQGHEPRDPAAVYARAVLAEEQHRAFEAEAVQAHIEVMLYRPQFVVEVEGADPSSALAEQVYPDWQPLTADGPDDAEIYLVRVPRGARLAPTALYAFASALNRAPDADVVYADEDRIDIAGRRSDTVYKPTWSPDQLESAPYLGFAACFRWSLARQALAQATCHYDFLLRITETARRIEHVASIILHRPPPPAESDVDARALDVAALAARLRRLGRVGTVAAAANGYVIAQGQRSDGLTAIVLADEPDAKTASTRLTRCLSDLQRAGGGGPRQVIVVGRDLAIIEATGFPDLDPCVLGPGEDADRSRQINLAVARARYDELLILRTDLVPTDDEWLERLRGHLTKPEVGACGAAILSPDRRRYEHLGLTVIDGDPQAIGMNAARWPSGEGTARNRLATTSSCLLTRTSLVGSVGGFARDIGAPRADFDYCQKLAAGGYRTVCESSATLIREPGPIEPGPKPDKRAVERFDRQWARRLVEDPLHPEYRADGDVPYQVTRRLMGT